MTDTVLTPLEDGNTTSSSTRNSRSRTWFFTWNNYPDSAVDTLTHMFKEAKSYKYQSEVGDEKWTPHIQGVVTFRNARYFTAMKKLNDKIHWEKTRNEEASYDYCGKEETWDGKIREEYPKPKAPIRDPIETPHPWQQEIIDWVMNKAGEGIDDRTIHWIYDKEGNKGKTALCKHLCLKHKALYVGGKAADIKYAITEWLAKENELPIVLIDITRSQESFISYEAIEAVKNGIFFSNKYESGMVIFNSPLVICFANFLPEIDKLSEDRWKIKRINPDMNMYIVPIKSITNKKNKLY